MFVLPQGPHIDKTSGWSFTRLPQGTSTPRVICVLRSPKAHSYAPAHTASGRLKLEAALKESESCQFRDSQNKPEECGVVS